jgi:hypothetical protein
MPAKILFEQLQQPVPVPVFLRPHLAEFCRLFRIALLQALRKILIDPRVLLLQSDGQRQHFTLTETVKRSHK